MHLFNTCWHTRTLPDELRDANIITLYKNEVDHHDCNSYRGISLLSTAGKVLSRIILPRLRSLADQILPESQAGFRPNRSTLDMIFSFQQLQEKCIEQRRPLYVDLTKAFDYVRESHRLICSPGVPGMSTNFTGYHQSPP